MYLKTIIPYLFVLFLLNCTSGKRVCKQTSPPCNKVSRVTVLNGLPDHQRPCDTLADFPDEILIRILHEVAITDVRDFRRLSRVCKRLAYLVASEQRIWRRVALGSEVGSGSRLPYHCKQILCYRDSASRALCLA